jgi:hypothetical protein
MENYRLDFDTYCKNKSEGVDLTTLGKTTPEKRTKEDYLSIFESNFDEEKVLEFYVDFKPQIWTRLGNKDRIKECLEKSLRRVLYKSKTNPKILLINETSPLGHYHYHGYIQDVNKTRITEIKRVCNFFGRHRIKYIRNIPDYYNYTIEDIDDGAHQDKYDIFINIK